jgi:hypothetical protein
MHIEEGKLLTLLQPVLQIVGFFCAPAPAARARIQNARKKTGTRKRREQRTVFVIPPKWDFLKVYRIYRRRAPFF